MENKIVINNVEYKFDKYGVLVRWFGILINKRKYIYVYTIDVPNFDNKVRIKSSKPLKVKHFTNKNIIENVPIKLYADYYRLKKVFKDIEVINYNGSYITPVIKVKLKLKRGINKLKKYCQVFCNLDNKTSITPVVIEKDYYEFRLYDYSCPKAVIVNDIISTDPKATYIAMLFVSAQIGKPIVHLFNPIKGKEYVYFKCD